MPGAAGTRFALLLVAAILLGGCLEDRTAAVPAPFTGCWHQVAAASRSGLSIDDPQEVGLLTIGRSEVLCDLEGLPRGVVAIGEFGGDPGLGSGRLALANGLRLYLSVGHGAGDYAVPGGSVVGDAGWLDVHVLRATAAGARSRSPGCACGRRPRSPPPPAPSPVATRR